MGVSQKVWCTFRTRKEVKPTKNLCLENLVRCHYARTTDFKMEHILWLLNFLNHKTNGTNTLSVLCIVNNLIIRATSNLNGYASVTSFLLYNLFIATKCKNVIRSFCNPSPQISDPFFNSPYCRSKNKNNNNNYHFTIHGR